MIQNSFLDAPPQSETLTPYDREHLSTYLRLLDAEADGALWQDVVETVFGLDPRTEPDRSAQVYATHIARARWMTENGYRHLIQTRFH
ncbi:MULTISPECIES: DNA -binding domain-containing protein [Sphingomonadaceae]|uniref:Uncharacterized conserved protein n=2 Tax=Sphingomonadaceae TaxID=41297 RepID=A0A239IJT0_9SPHN|nr:MULTISPECIES: DUF2285 domain-containing protein [Sphingomonadaceae]EQB33894.1 hypothetical protein M529_02460 [Sphingobium ummariense RL-3]WOF45954.1 DUF2285 domain-containing protein [Sphingopyxis indica]SNS93900.1 Uncharacterized conserved protein [Sphingopyxis indica]